MKQGDYIALAALVFIGFIGWKAATSPTKKENSSFSSACGCGA